MIHAYMGKYAPAFNLYWWPNFRKELASERGWKFQVVTSDKGTVAGMGAEPFDGNSCVSISTLKDGVDPTKSTAADVTFDYRVPLHFMRQSKRLKYTLYNVRFRVYLDEWDYESSAPLRAGYYGITKRDPFERLAEHSAKVKKGEGHILHKTWRSLIDRELSHAVVFQVADNRQTLDEIYDSEERVVDECTLAPKGLNAIPGGYAGIKFLHNLGMMGRNEVDVASRDCALCSLESSKRAAHYRRGHIRNLQSGKSTWVSPHWVNLGNEVVA